MNLAAVAKLRTAVVAGTWYRAIQSRYLATPLAYGHTGTSPGRFNGGSEENPGPEAIYLTEDLLTAQFEVEVLVRTSSPSHPVIPVPTTVPWSIVPVQVSLTAVADLTDPVEVAKLGVSFQTLTGDWRGFSYRPVYPVLRAPYFTNVPTQRLGYALHRHGFEGFLTYSSRLTTKKNLVLFPARVRKGSSATHTDAAGVVHAPAP